LINSGNKITEVETDGTYQGYVGIAFQNAFYHLLNTHSFNEVMIYTLCLGGDTDTNACIAGALYGACYGCHRIDEKWLQCIMKYASSKKRIDLYKPLDHQYVCNMLKEKLNKL